MPLEHFYKSIILNQLHIFDLNEFLKLDSKLKYSISTINIYIRYLIIFHNDIDNLKQYINKLNKYFKNKYLNLNTINIYMDNLNYFDFNMFKIISSTFDYNVVITFKMNFKIYKLESKLFIKYLKFVISELKDNISLKYVYKQSFKNKYFELSIYNNNEFIELNELINKLNNILNDANINTNIINYRIIIINKHLINVSEIKDENIYVNFYSIILKIDDYIKYYNDFNDNTRYIIELITKEFNFHKHYLNYSKSFNLVLPSEIKRVKYLPRNEYRLNYLPELLYFRTYKQKANVNELSYIDYKCLKNYNHLYYPLLNDTRISYLSSPYFVNYWYMMGELKTALLMKY